MSHEKSKRNSDGSSVLYLALLCLLYFFLTSNYLPFGNDDEFNQDDLIYVEISEDDSSKVISVTNPAQLKALKSKHKVTQDLRSGDKIVIEGYSSIEKMSGLKRISLGIPIGINSAELEDLTAIPGIGPLLAQSIIDYISNKEEIESIDELDSIEGIGKYKLESLKSHTTID
ncbi:MAG: helix-hairpin-helix domain-containing protein [Thermodesulfobacteriota bacterium]